VPWGEVSLAAGVDRPHRADEDGVEVELDQFGSLFGHGCDRLEDGHQGSFTSMVLGTPGRIVTLVDPASTGVDGQLHAVRVQPRGPMPS
jgi:hypothetical protein